jgi:RNA polymerase sigma-70 factor, ECF subfamily
LEPDEIDDLARRAQTGDREAMEMLLGATRPRVLNVCRGVLPFNPDAEDACQEALLSIALKINQWHGQHVVALNAARTTYRKLKSQATPTDAPLMERPDPRTTSVIAGTTLDILEAMDAIEVTHPQYVQPLLLRDVYQLTYPEIAEQLGLPLGTVKAQVHHGRALARPLLRMAP